MGERAAESSTHVTEPLSRASTARARTLWGPPGTTNGETLQLLDFLSRAWRMHVNALLPAGADESASGLTLRLVEVRHMGSSRKRFAGRGVAVVSAGRLIEFDHPRICTDITVAAR